MTRLAIVIALMPLGACFQSHPAGQQELAGRDCNACHTTDYEATAAPIHHDTPQVFSTSCVNCHRQTSWQPALEGLHNDLFAVSEGPHAQISCLGCHDLGSALPSKLGANTNCLPCHPDTVQLTALHAGITLFAGTPYAYDATVPSFCLECHPTGLKEAHPEVKFARAGNHAVPCSDCHDRTRGPDNKGTNVTCVEAKCHHTVQVSDLSINHATGAYRKSRGDGSSPTFCHDCH